MKSRRLLPIQLIALAVLLVGACAKAPLVPDAPKGPAQWLRSIASACTTSTTDASGGQVSYQFDWGDDTKSEWSPFLDGGVQYADTHSYANIGSYQIKVRAKNSKRASGWSDPLSIRVVAEGNVAWSVGFTDPDDIEDSSDFSLNTIAIGSGHTAYIACDYGALIACKPSGGIAWKFVLPDLDQIMAAPVLADDGTILIGCSNDFIYALNPDGSVKWADSVGQVAATGALGADGTAYFQTVDSMIIALRSDGSTLWTFDSIGGNAAPVVGTDGTVYAANQDGVVYAINPDGSQKWQYLFNLPSVQAPAIDPSRNRLYVVSDAGALQSVDLTTGLAGISTNVGQDASGPVVGPDGSVFISGGGVLTKLSPDFDELWKFTPPFGVLSTPALTVDGYVYVLAVAGKKGRLALQDDVDSLYAVNPDGTQRWACGLGEGLSDPEYPLSAPKIDPNGLIYVGDGFRGWCVGGLSAPAQSIWPTFQHDAQNSGRAR